MKRKLIARTILRLPLILSYFHDDYFNNSWNCSSLARSAFSVSLAITVEAENRLDIIEQAN